MITAGCWQVAGCRISCDWVSRNVIWGYGVIEALVSGALAARPLIADDDLSAVLLTGMMVCATDGMLVAVADTPW